MKIQSITLVGACPQHTAAALRYCTASAQGSDFERSSVFVVVEEISAGTCLQNAQGSGIFL